MLGGIITPSYLKKYSRKTVITCFFWASIIMSVVLCMGPALILIYILRFLIGCAMGIYLSQVPCIIT